MEESKKTSTREDRGRLWPILFGLMGLLSIADYFYKHSFQPDDLLKGLGFLLMVPLAYLYPNAHSSKHGYAHTAAAPWAKHLSYAGLTLVIAGFTAQWM